MNFFGAMVSPSVSPVVFEAGGRQYDLGSVIQAADFLGILQPFWRHWHHALVKSNLASQLGLEVEEAVLEGLADEFRYGRDLVTAEECENWLAARGVTPGDFLNHFVRRHWAVQPAAEMPWENERVDGETEPLWAFFRTDLVLAEEFDRAARQLAWRVALACEEATKPPGGGASPARSLLDPAAANGKARDEIVSVDPGYLTELQRLEAVFQAHSQQLLTAENRGHCLASLRFSLFWFEIRLVEFDSAVAAREAYLCVKHDGLSLADVAGKSGHPVSRLDVFLEELPLHWQPALFSAAVGTVLPPFDSTIGAQLCFLDARHEPALSDHRVRSRVDETIRRQYFMELEARHVRWCISIQNSV